MKKLLILIPFLAAGCGPYKVQVEQKDPIVVTHKLDTSDLEKYFKAKCVQNNPGADDATIQTCVDSSVADFLDTIK